MEHKKDQLFYPDESIICIYHNKDLDGFTSGALVKEKYPNAHFFGWDYKDDNTHIIEFIEDLSKKYEERIKVIMVDISFKMYDMFHISDFILNSEHNFIWIDHHVSAKNDYIKYTEEHDEKIKLKYVYNNNFSACELTYLYFNEYKNVDWNNLSMTSNSLIPYSIHLLGYYDVWRNNDKEFWSNSVLPFQFGMRSVCNSIESFPIKDYKMSSFASMIQRNGEVIIEYKEKYDELVFERASFEREIAGYNALVVNGFGFNSDSFNSKYNKKEHDLLLSFFFDGIKYSWTVFSPEGKINCQEFAKMFGGGGHKGAAGFSTFSTEEVFDYEHYT